MHLQHFFWFSVTLVVSVCQKEQNPSLLNELESVYEGLEENQIKLKHIIEEVSVTRTKGCVCVPYYLCDDGQVNTKGNRLIELRANTNPCENQVEICCELPRDVTAEAKQNSKCGLGDHIDAKSNNANEISSNFGELPWTVMILKDRTRYQCVGSLIHPRIVLTAAHCVHPNEDNYTVRGGEWDASTTDELYPHQVQDVVSIAIHPNYNDLDHKYDAALLLLENPFKLDKNVNTICLKETHIDLSNCFGSGWGLDPILNNYQRVMKKIPYNVIPNTLCEMKLRGTRLGWLFELDQSFVCAEGKKRRELCTGDGGAPLVCSSMNDHNRFIQVGIAVWGLGCETESPSVFASVSVVYDWIESQLEEWKVERKAQENTKFSKFMD